MNPPFKPTECSCAADQANCKRQPGYLIPGQMAEILNYIGAALTDAAKYFWRSPGMVLGDMLTRKVVRVNTITPRFENGKCVFFENGLCRIHPVAPFGCRYFDEHMGPEEGNARSMWGAMTIVANIVEYSAERDSLPNATHYRPR